MRSHLKPRLGIDIGRVIIDGSAHPLGGDTAFFQGDESTMLATPEMANAVDVIARLVIRFEREVWLISKCGPRVQARTERWLAWHEFFRRTGLPPDHVRFCRVRADKRIYSLQFGLTHFIDDHPEVHAAIRDLVRYQYFFGPQQAPVPSYGQHAANWLEVERLIERSLRCMDR